MLYERYEQRVRRTFQLLQIMNQYRILIMSVLGVVLLSASGFSFTKGIMYDISIPSSFEYSESFEISSKALFSSVTYRYREEGSTTWSDIQPTTAGNYEVEITSNQVFGGSNSKIIPFTITPKPTDITLTEPTIIFGEEPQFTALLGIGDYIDYVDFTYENLALSQTTISIDEIVVRNSSGSDVTSSYSFTDASLPISFTKRNVTIALNDVSSIYNGMVLTSEDYTIASGSIPEDQQLIITASGSQTDVGTSLNSIVTATVTSNGTNVSNNYQFTFIDGALEVTPRNITITSGDTSRIYDGTPLSDPSFSITDGTLVDGHRVVITDETTITSVGTTDNILTIQILDENDTDVTSNYTITQLYGQLEVTVKSITIDTSSSTKTYDGTALIDENYILSSGSLASLQSIQIISSTSITDVGTLDNVLEITILDANSDDVTTNYNITYNYGELEITTRNLTIETASTAQVYNGTPLIDSNYTITDGSLAAGDNIDIVSQAMIRNVGVVDNAFTIDIKHGDAIVTSNYTITFEFGTLEITHRSITIQPQNETRVYNGLELSSTTPIINDGSLVSGHVLSITTNGSIDTVGLVQNEITHATILDNGVDVTSNYDITYETGSLEVTRRLLTIDTASNSKIYDALPLFDESYNITSGTLVEGQTIEIIDHTSITNVGTTSNQLSIQIMQDTDIDVTSNYQITFNEGILEITERSISIQPENVSSVYDGTVLTSTTVDLIAGTLANGHTIVITTDGTQLNVGSSTNTIVTVTITENGTDVSDNYDITQHTGTLEVTSRPLTIETNSNTTIYNGQPFFDEGYTITSGSLAINQTIEVVSRTEITDAGTVNNTLTFDILDSGANDVSDNYTITIIDGTLEVTKRDITIVTSSASKGYDQTPLISVDYTITSGELAPNHQSIVTANASITEVGVLDNVLTIEIQDEYLNDVTDNYSITMTLGSLEITPRVLSIVTNSTTRVYDGTPLIDQGFAITDGVLASGDVISVLTYPSITYVGTLSNILVLEIHDAEGINVTENYDLNYTYGDLEVTRRDITITSASEVRIYNGSALFNENYSITDGSLAAGDSIVITNHSSLTDVGLVDNVLTIDIQDGTSTSMSNNYNITLVYGELQVTPRAIELTTNNASQVYDGTPLYNQGYTITSGDLVVGDSISIDTDTRLTNVGSVNNVLSITITDITDIDVTSNYTITYVEGTLEVTPRIITIQPTFATKVYDGEAITSTLVTVTSGTLVEGELLTITTTGSQIDVGTSTNTVVSTLIMDGLDDVTDNYTITTLDGTLEVTPRPITIQPSFATKVYDATALTSQSWNLLSGTIIEGHTLSITTSGTQTNVGTSTNPITSSTIFNGAIDVTSNYAITTLDGTLEVTPRPLELTTSSDSKVYDATPLTNQGYTITSGSLVLGDSITVLTSSTITNVGTIDNAFIIRIEDNTVTDVTGNYSITYVEGTLTITPRPITIQTASDSKVYDSLTLSNDSYLVTEGSLVPGDLITVLTSSDITNVGTVSNAFTISITDISVQDVTSNYTITYSEGTLEITPRPITIDTASDSKQYDGTSLSNQGFIISSGTLVAGDNILITSSTEIINVGSVDNAFTITIEDGAFLDVTSNYDISYHEGTLQITPLAITIDTASDSKIYDGTDLTNPSYVISNGSLAPGDSITVTTSSSITNVGTISNEFTIQINNTVSDDVTSNYTITYNEGTLEITPRPIELTTNSDTKVYDGTPLSNPGYTITSGSLADGDTLSVLTSSEITTVGTLSNQFTIGIENSALDDVLSNYSVTYIEGTLEVTPRPITITSDNDSKVYDGTPLSNPSFSITEGSLVAGQSTSVDSYTELTIVDVVDNVLVLSILTGDLTDVTSNYAITYEHGFLEVEPIILVISTASDTKLYDGTPLTNSTWELSEGSVLSEHTLSVTVTGTITEIGVTRNTFNATIVDGSSADVSMYYIIVENTGVLEIERSKVLLEIQSNSDSKIYDGTPLTRDEWTIYEGELLAGHTIEVTVTGTITDIGTTPNTFTYTILDESLNDVTTSHYDIEVTYGSLTIVDTDENGTNSSSSTTISNEGSLDEGPPQTVLQVYSEVNDIVYLRDKSYGDYNKSGWDAPVVFYSPYSVTPFLFPTFAINNTLDSYQLQVKAVVTGMSYYLPYYANNGFYSNINDVFVNHSYTSSYSVDYVPLYDVDYSTLTITDPTYQAYEAEYRSFVYATYLQLPRETKDALLDIAAANGLNPSNATIISDVQSYIQTAGIYNEEYDPIPDNVDIALYFLEVSREGICQHFATAGVAMYRALGIPARYVTGFYVQTIQEEWVDVNSKQAHAWVEIYIDGFGWVPIEVTGGGFGDGTNTGFGSLPGEGDGTGTGSADGDGSASGDGSGDGGTGDGSGETLITIDIYSANDAKTYDGSPLTNDFYYKIGTLQGDHQLYVTVTGTITSVGEVDNTFTYVILDGFGTDVTDQYNVNVHYGTLIVVPLNDLEIMEFQVFDISTTYNGTAITHSDNDYWIPSQNLPAGYTVILDIVGEITNVGSVTTYINKTSIVILDENMIDVTNQYNIITYDGSITVNKRNITITSFSASKDYDGTPLTSDIYYVSSGSLASGDTENVTITGTITEPGSTANTISSVTIENAVGADVTNNYTITLVNGTLTVDSASN